MSTTLLSIPGISPLSIDMPMRADVKLFVQELITVPEVAPVGKKACVEDLVAVSDDDDGVNGGLRDAIYETIPYNLWESMPWLSGVDVLNDPWG